MQLSMTMIEIGLRAYEIVQECVAHTVTPIGGRGIASPEDEGLGNGLQIYVSGRPQPPKRRPTYMTMDFGMSCALL